MNQKEVMDAMAKTLYRFMDNLQVNSGNLQLLNQGVEVLALYEAFRAETGRVVSNFHEE